MKSERKLSYISASKLCVSNLLPERTFDLNQVEAIRKDGVQQVIIVRPSKSQPGMYEIVDGHMRFKTLQGDRQVLVDVRLNLDDAGVFQLSEAMFRRRQRSTYERCMFYTRWAEELTRGGAVAAQQEIAKAANLSEAMISTYVAVGRLFNQLRRYNIPEPVFDALKTQSVNKLCELGRIGDDKLMIAVMARMLESPRMPVDMLREIIEEEIRTAHADPLRGLRDTDEDTKKTETELGIARIKEALQRLDVATAETSKTMTTLSASVNEAPQVFVKSAFYHRIEVILRAFKKIELEANRLIASKMDMKQSDGKADT